MHYISFKKFANNEIRVSKYRQPTRRKVEGDNDSDRICEANAKLLHLATATEVVKGFASFAVMNGPSGKVNRLVDKSEAQQLEEVIERSRSYLSSSRNFNATRKSTLREDDDVSIRRRNKGLSGYARHTILEAGAVTERWSGLPERSALVTLTIPGNIKSEYLRFGQFTGGIVNRLLQVLRRRYKDVLWFYVWERQKRDALHLHLALTSYQDGRAMQAGGDLVAAWERILEDCSAKYGIDVTSSESCESCVPKYLWRNRTEVVRKSLAAYLSKYISKGKQTPSETSVSEGFCPPKRWWGMSRQLTRMVKKDRLSVRVAVTEDEAQRCYLDMCKTIKAHEPDITYEREFEIDKEGRSLVQGKHFYGYFPGNFVARTADIVSSAMRCFSRHVGLDLLTGNVEKMLNYHLGVAI